MSKKHIHIVSPSGAIDERYIDMASERLRGWGFRVTESAHARGHYHYFSATTEERFADLQRAFDDDDIDIVLCSRGGYGLAQYVDRLRLNPKQLLVGFSDITCLHNLAGTQGISSLHGLMCKHIATLPEDSESLRMLRDILSGAPMRYELLQNYQPLNISGVCSGILRGGNLSVMCGLRGSLLDIPDQGRGTILFLEDIAEPAHHIDRMMHNLRLGGILQNISGLIVGQFTDCKEDDRFPGTIYSRIHDMVSIYDYPVVFDFPAGHTERNIPMMFNTRTTLKVGPERTLIYSEK